MNPLNEKQISALRGLHFWYRNMLVSRRESDFLEYKKSTDAIRHIYQDLDRLKVTFYIQNKVSNAAEENISFSQIQL